jgi:acetyl-CoA C-acetyltransferase
MSARSKALFSRYNDVFLLDGVRTPFIEYNTALGLVSPTDLGIKAARAVFERSGVAPADVDIVVAGNMAQASFDAYMLPRHIGLYSGVCAAPA